MIRRIVLENFMSHRRTVIEPADGLTVLVGPNNCGKSAVVVALQCMNTCDNRSAPFIRHGEKEARVVVDTDEGSRVEWIRGKNYTNYKINGREMTRARRPEDLDDHLKLAQVESEDGKRCFDLHFAEQKNPIFLLNESGAAAATFFAASSDAAYLVQMQSLLKRKESEARTRRRDLEGRIDRQKRQLQAFEDLSEIETQVKDVQIAHNELLVLKDSMAQLQSVLFSLEEGAIEALSAEEEVKALAGVTVPPNLEPTDELARYVSVQERLESRVQRMTERSSALEILPVVPEIADASPLAAAIDVLARKQRAFAKLTDKMAISEQATAPPNLEDLADLAKCIEDLDNKLVHFDRLSNAFSETQTKAEDARRQLIEYVAAHPTCPVCGSILSAEKLLMEVSA